MRQLDPPVTLHTVLEAGIPLRYGVVHAPDGAWMYRWALEDVPENEDAYCEIVAWDYKVWRQGGFVNDPFRPWTDDQDGCPDGHA
jgi:hypothetical protein